MVIISHQFKQTVTGVQKNHLIETVLLSTQTYNLVEKKEINFQSGGLIK